MLVRMSRDQGNMNLHILEPILNLKFVLQNSLKEMQTSNCSLFSQQALKKPPEALRKSFSWVQQFQAFTLTIVYSVLNTLYNTKNNIRTLH